VHSDREESGTLRDETIGAETTVAVLRTLRGSTRNTDGTMIDAASSGVTLLATIEGVRSCLCRHFSESRYSLIPFLSALKNTLAPLQHVAHLHQLKVPHWLFGRPPSAC